MSCIKSPRAVPLAFITFTPENSAALAFWTDLTGLSVQEIANCTLPGDILDGWSRLSTRRRAVTDFRIDDPDFGDQHLRSLSPTAAARWRRNPMELIER
jgi:hypothetical protein